MSLDEHRLELPSKDELVENIQLLTFRQNLWALNLGILQNNFSVSEKFLNQGKTTGDTLAAHIFVQWRKCFGHYLAKFSCAIQIEDWTAMWCSAWNKIS